MTNPLPQPLIATFPHLGRHSYIAWLAIAVASLWMRSGFPVFAHPLAIFDDALFVRTARYLGAGEWLGPYDQLTLAKGMFYPLFILAAFWSTFPLKIAEQIVYLCVGALTGRLVARSTGRTWPGLLLFGLLAFNPVLWTDYLARVIREGLYISLTLGLVVLMVMVAVPGPGHAGGRPRVRSAWACILGCVGGAFWLTREEGLCLLPALAVIAAIGLAAQLGPWRDGVSLGARLARGRRMAGLLAIACLCAGAETATVAALNAWYYGVFMTVESRSDAFQHAYGAISRIKHDHWRPFVLFPKDASDRAYAVSPAARELEPFLAGQMGEDWKQAAVEQMPGVDPSEILSPWFIWAFREATALAGHYRSAPDTMAFYEKLAQEIDAACADGRLACLAPRATLAPPFHSSFLRGTAISAKKLTRITFGFGDGNVKSMPSETGGPLLAKFADFVGEVTPTAASTYVVTGWIAATASVPSLNVSAKPGQFAETSIELGSGEDVRRVYPNLKPVRFALRSDCEPETCTMVIDVAGAHAVSVPWAQVVAGTGVNTGDVMVSFDSVKHDDATRASRERRAIQARIGRAIGHVYARAFPVLFGLALAGLALAFALRRVQHVPLALVALSAGSAVAIASRILLLSYIDATSMPATTILYAAPATPFVIVFASVGLYLGACALWPRRISTLAGPAFAYPARAASG